MNEEIIRLLLRNSRGEWLNESEKKELDEWLSQSKHNRSLYDDIMNQEELQGEIKKMLGVNSASVWNKISTQLYPKKNRFRLGFYQYAAAAAVLFLVFISIYFLYIKKEDHNRTLSSLNPSVVHDIPPGSQGAVLTLSDGKQMVLDNTANGQITVEGSTRVIKSDNGQLVYQASGDDHPGSEALRNTMTTDKGKQYKLVLSDGTAVYLNAASSLNYPLAFTGDERLVTLTGEAIFEVAKNPKKPFRVKVKNSIVEAVGTQFNINAYDDERAINTTLVEGLVKVSVSGKNSFLKPGQQSRIDEKGNISIDKNADIEQVTAWKNGYFSFKKDDIHTIMRQVARWYNVSVEYVDDIPVHFVATPSRSEPLSKLLKTLEKMGGVHFEIDDIKKRVLVRR